MDTVKNRGGRRPSAIAADPNVGERLKFLRMQQGLSQAELAEGICTTAVVSHLETGRSGTTVETLKKFADRLNVPLYEIFREPQGDYPYMTKLELVEAYILRGEFEPAQEFLNYLADRDDLNVVENQRRLLLQGMLYNKKSEPENALAVVQPLIDQIEEKQNADDEITCQLYTQVGTAYYNLRDFTKAYAAYKRGYQMSLRLWEFGLTAAIAAYNLGMICNEMGIGNEAIIYLDQAREYYESVADLRKLADAYFYSAVASHDEAYITKALTLYQTIDAAYMVQVVKQYYAYHVEAKKDYRKAVQHLTLIAAEMEKVGNGDCIFTLARAAIVCLDNDDLEEAHDRLKLADEYVERMPKSTPYNLALMYRAKARVNLCVGKYDECISNAQQSAEMYGSMGMYRDTADSLELVVEAYHQKGELGLALETSRKAIAMLRQLKG